MQAFIFDFNGTLYLDMDIHRRAWKLFMSRHGQEIDDETFYRYMFGPNNSVILRRFFGDLDEGEVWRLSGEKEALYREIALSDPALQRLAPGAPQMLDMLKSRGVPFAIATASIRKNVDFYMNSLGIRRWFDYDHVFFEMEGLPGKPDPSIYLLTMEKLRYDPENTVVVEDSMPGIQSAVAAGVSRIIAIDTTLGPDAFKEIPQVSAVIHDFFGFERFVGPD